MHTCIHSYVHTYIRTYIIHTNIHTYIYTYMHKCIHAYIHAYIHNAYMHTCNLNGCRREGVLTKRWKKARIVPIVKTGKEGSDEVNKFRPISLLDSGGKVLEKLLINRINYHAYSRAHMIKNQFGFGHNKVR